MGIAPKAVWIAIVLAAATVGSYRAVAQTSKTETAPSGGAIPVKVLIVGAFAGEATGWVTGLDLRRSILLPGLSLDYPAVACNDAGICHVTTGMGHANAAASITALLFSNKFDFRHAYFLIAGVAGVNPLQGTIGSAAWARYVVDIGIANEFDSREVPAGWTTGYFGLRTRQPGEKPPIFHYRTEMFRLDEALLQKVLALTTKAQLQDDDVTRAYRGKYGYPPANGPPTVMQCDVIVSDTFRRGALLGQHAEQWMRLLTDGAGTYCVGDQEDTAVLNAMTRAAHLGLMDLKRVAVLRAGSDFDRPYPGQTAYESYLAEWDRFGQSSAFANLYIVGSLWVNDVVLRWNAWEAGVPRD